MDQRIPESMGKSQGTPSLAAGGNGHASLLAIEPVPARLFPYESPLGTAGYKFAKQSRFHFEAPALAPGRFTRPALQDYISLVNQQLPGLMKACFIEGSIALGGFNEHFSGIDFLIVIDRTATPTEIESLHLIHKTIEKDYPQREFMGNYLPADAWSLFDGQGRLSA